MWESFNLLPIWLKAIIVITILAILVGTAVAFIYFIIGLRKKVESSEKVELSKSGLQLEDIDAHSEIKDANGNVTTVDTKINKEIIK